MVKFGKDFFKAPDREEEQKIVTANMYNEETYRRIASIYGVYVFKWSGKKIFFLPRHLGQKEKDKRVSQMKRLINIITELGVPIEVYIKAQFEEQMSFLKTKGLAYVPFINLISKNAVQRFERYKKRIDISYTSDDSRSQEFYSTQALNIQKAIVGSMEIFYNRLKRVKELIGDVELTDILMLQELETMARAGQVSNIYVYSSALVRLSDFVKRFGSGYLGYVQAEVDKKLNDFEKKEVEKVRKEVLETFEDKEILKYV